MAGELISFGNRVSKIVDPAVLKRVLMAGGMAGKKAALDAASRDLGGDRAFSGLGRKVSLSAGFDDVGSTLIRLNFRPQGLWMLAEKGRRSGGVIRPKRGRAVLTPDGPRALSHYKPNPGGAKNTFTDAVRDAKREVPKAAAKQFHLEVAKVVR